MTAQTPIARLVAAADRATLSDKPTPEQIDNLSYQTGRARTWLSVQAGQPEFHPARTLFWSLVQTAEKYLEKRTDARAAMLGYVCRAAHKVDAMAQRGEL